MEKEGYCPKRHNGLRASRSRIALFLFTACLVLSVALTGATTARGAEVIPATFQFTSKTVPPGWLATVLFQTTTDFPYQGLSAAAVYEPKLITIYEVTPRDTICEWLPVEFFDVNIDPEKGELIIGILADVRPPFEGQTLPGIGTPLTVAQVNIGVPMDVGTRPQTTTIHFADGIGDPPIYNRISVENISWRPEHTLDGFIEISGYPQFIRADANWDQKIDIADAVFTISYVFQGERAPPCLDAADSNNDEAIDLSDAIFTLMYCFGLGRKPSPPFPYPGSDSLSQLPDLGCEQSLF